MRKERKRPERRTKRGGKQDRRQGYCLHEFIILMPAQSNYSTPTKVINPHLHACFQLDHFPPAFIN